VGLGLLPPEGRSLVLAAALISITLNPLLFAAVEPAQRWIRSRSSVARALERRDDPLAELPATVETATLTGHVVLVGYGRVGSRIAEALLERGIAFVVAEQNREIVERLRERHIHAVTGDAAQPEVLVQAHVARAALLVVATPDTPRVRRIVEIARTLKPEIPTMLRTHSDEESALLRQANLGTVFMGEHELAVAMTREVIDHMRSAGTEMGIAHYSERPG
jgi:CPA2 family monovalent cation:H+ antiporter-2